MTFPYDTPLTTGNKVDRDTYPLVPAINKVLAGVWNEAILSINRLATAITSGSFLGLAGGSSPDVAPVGGVRLKAGVAGLETSFDGGAYVPVGGSIPDASSTVAGKVNLADQVLGAGVKKFQSALALATAPTAPVSVIGEVRLRSGSSNALEISANGSDYMTLTEAVNDVTGSSGGKINLNNQTMGAGVKTFQGSIAITEDWSAPLSEADCISMRYGPTGFELSIDGGNYAAPSVVVPDASDTVAGIVSLSAQTMGTGLKTFMDGIDNNGNTLTGVVTPLNYNDSVAVSLELLNSDSRRIAAAGCTVGTLDTELDFNTGNDLRHPELYGSAPLTPNLMCVGHVIMGAGIAPIINTITSSATLLVICVGATEGTLTITHGATIRLSGGVDAVLTDGGSIQLIRNGLLWCEMCRCQVTL